MASPIDSIASLPTWQKAVAWAFFSAILGGGWYFLFFADALEERRGAEAAVAKAETELVKMKEKLANFEEEQRKAAEMEKEIRTLMEELPTSAATVDNIMQTFQQQARMVGLDVESWTPGGEERLDFYAKLPVEVRAAGSWHAVGEFMRRVSEFKKIVSVENLVLTAEANPQQAVATGPLNLQIGFRAATYRFLTDEERAGTTSEGAEGSRRRTGGGQ
jgi:type IV pilus assembly protein PilO